MVVGVVGSVVGAVAMVVIGQSALRLAFEWRQANAKRRGGYSRAGRAVEERLHLVHELQAMLERWLAMLGCQGADRLGQAQADLGSGRVLAGVL